MHINLFIAGILTVTLGFCSDTTTPEKTKVPDSITGSDGQILTPYGFEDAIGNDISKEQYEAANDPKASIIWQDKDGRTTRSGG
jgi:hypothetical protein